MPQLTKSLGPLAGTALMLNIVIGAGILILPGLAAREAGASSFWSWVLAALVSIPLLAIFCKLGSKYPNAGGILHFIGLAFGRKIHIIASFVFLGAVALGLPALALTGGYYFESFSGISPHVTAFGIVGFALLGNFLKPSWGSKFGATISALVILFIVCVVVVSLFAIPPANIEQAVSGIFSTETIFSSRVFLPFMLVFFAFTGWDVSLSTTEEFKNPKRTIPLSIALSFVVASFFYLLCAFVVIAAGPSAYTQAPFAVILAPTPLYFFLSLGATFLIFANIFSALWGVSRLIFSLAREDIFPSWLAATSQGVPRAALCVTGSFIFLGIIGNMLGLITVQGMLAQTGQIFFFFYAAVTLVLLKLDRTVTGFMLSILCLIIVGVLLFFGGQNFLFPLSLAIIGGVMALRPMRST